jgi:hypothetical protein
MKLSDVRRDSWFQISAAIKRGERPDAENLARALRGAEAIPPSVRSYIAGLVDGSTERRGRPNTWTLEAHVDLFNKVSFLKGLFKMDGVAAPMKKAFEVERAYRKATRELKLLAARKVKI